MSLDALNPEFQAHVEGLETTLKRLTAAEPAQVCGLPRKMPSAGVYLLSERDQHLYVGRSSKMRQRILLHCQKSAGHGKAALAFRLARRATGKLKASYRSEGSRSQLAQDPEFAQAFADAKERIREMDVRVVEETDPVRQALLEIYAAVSLHTPFNEFRNT